MSPGDSAASVRALVAPDKFKGTLSAREVATAIAAGLECEADVCPVADGGEGTAEALLAAAGGEWASAPASDPLGRVVECRFAMLADGASAVVEVAEASGLWRLADDERDPLGASSRGTGELIAAATARGASRVLVACGGSATTDGGAGALSAFDPAAAELTCLCDTDVAFMAAARTFAPQKGAAPEQVEQLERRLAALADELPHDPRRLPYAGAAGGLAGGLWAHGARLVAGAGHVLAALDFDRRLAGAGLVITGEGQLDATSWRGKAVGEVARRAARAGVPCHAIVGRALGDADPRDLLASIREARTPAEIERAAASVPT